MCAGCVCVCVQGVCVLRAIDVHVQHVMYMYTCIVH